jgi:hypothetical protein
MLRIQETAKTAEPDGENAQFLCWIRRYSRNRPWSNCQGIPRNALPRNTAICALVTGSLGP